MTWWPERSDELARGIATAIIVHCQKKWKKQKKKYVIGRPEGPRQWGGGKCTVADDGEWKKGMPRSRGLLRNERVFPRSDQLNGMTWGNL